MSKNAMTEVPFNFTMGEDDSRRLAVVLKRGDSLLPSHLYQVTLTRQRKWKECATHPVVSQYLVLAPSPEEAISQVKQNAYPEVEGCLSDDEMTDCTGAAIEVPFHIRGWGRQTF